MVSPARKKGWACRLFAASAVIAGMVGAQDYPVKPVHMLVGFVAGSATDVAARMLGQKLGEAMGQQIVIENRTGAGGLIAIEAISKGVADGYTLLMTAASITIQPALRATLSFEVPRDFSPISRVVTGPFLLVVHPSVPAKSARDLIAIARSRPGRLNYASSGVGSSPHLAGELLNALAKIKTAHVPYKGSPQAVLAVANGETDFNFPSITAAQPLIDAGRLRALGVSTATRTALMPNIPTLDESGVAGYERNGWYGVIGPPAMPKELVIKLNAFVTKVVSTPEMKAAFFKQGLEPAATTPEQFGQLMQREVQQNTRLAREAGIGKE